MAEALSETQQAAEWFVKEVRTAMLDYEELNELINNQEVDYKEIKKAADRTIDRYNNIDPPISARTVWDFPSKDLLITGTIARLLISGALLHYRNQLPYSAGGISVQTHTQGPAYERLGAQLMSQFEQQADIMKRSENVQRMMGVAGGLGSQYGLLSWFNSSNDGW